MNLQSEPKHKQLTRFICQELLYEYVTDRLDPERTKAMALFISGCRDSQRELEALQNGLRYTTQLSEIQVSPSLREALLGFEPQWQKTLSALTLWSSQRGWRALPYIFLSLSVVLGLAILKPWQTSMHNELVLVEQLKKEPDLIAPAPEIKVEPASGPPVVAILPGQNVASPLPPQGVASTTPPLVVATAGSEVTTETQPTAAALATTQAEESVGQSDDLAATAMKGGLMRGELDSTDFAMAWPAIREKILALNGKVAGNVELGWLRKKDEAYFHFSIPDSNRQELEVFLNTFGPVRFSMERHPRVMPKGQIRIILTVKDGGLEHEGATETP